jgi:hypothetical protein
MVTIAGLALTGALYAMSNAIMMNSPHLKPALWEGAAPFTPWAARRLKLPT